MLVAHTIGFLLELGIRLRMDLVRWLGVYGHSADWPAEYHVIDDFNQPMDYPAILKTRYHTCAGSRGHFSCQILIFFATRGVERPGVPWPMSWYVEVLITHVSMVTRLDASDCARFFNMIR